MSKNRCKAKIFALLLLTAAAYSVSANAAVIPYKAPPEVPAAEILVGNDGYLVVNNTFDSQSIPPRFCPAPADFVPDSTPKATPCHQNGWFGAKEAFYPEMSAQAALDTQYGAGKVVTVGMSPTTQGRTVIYWRYAPVDAKVTAPAAASAVSAPAAVHPASSATH